MWRTDRLTDGCQVGGDGWLVEKVELGLQISGYRIVMGCKCSTGETVSNHQLWVVSDGC